MFPLAITGLQKMLGQEGGLPVGMLLQSLMGGGLGGNNQQGMQPGMGLFSGLMGGKNNQQSYGMGYRDPRMIASFDLSQNGPYAPSRRFETLTPSRPIPMQSQGDGRF